MMPGYYPPPGYGGVPVDDPNFPRHHQMAVPTPIPRVVPQVAQSRALWLGGVTVNVTDVDLRNEFAKYGMIDFIKVSFLVSSLLFFLTL